MNNTISSARVRTVSERLWSGFGWLIGILFATILVLDKAVYNILALIAVGIAFIAIYSYRPRLDTELKMLGLVLIANLLLALPNIILARDGLISLENPVRMLLMIPLVLAVMRYGLRARFICVGLSVGMLAAALVVSWQYHVMEVIRPGIHYNPILFSEVAMSAFAVLLAACLVIRDRLVPLYLAGLLAALYCVILSGTRGTLVAIIPLMIFLLWWGWRRDVWRVKSFSRWMILFPVILLFLGTVLISTGHFIDRVQLAGKQTRDYFERNDASTPIGQRLELWKGTLLVAREHPMLGIGEHKAFLKNKVANGELQPIVAIMRYAHNDYLGTLQSRGVPGLLLQLLIYILPLLIFLRGLAKSNERQRFAALGGVLMTIEYATYSLTEMPMHNGLPLVFYIVSTGLLIGIIKHLQSPNSADYSC